MQLKLQRSQRVGGALANTVIFCLDARAAYSDQEAANISKYKIGGEVIYSSEAAKRHAANMSAHLDRTQSGSVKDRSMGLARGLASLAMANMSLNITIASLGRGQHVECKNLTELLEAEETIMEACRKVKLYLEAAATFNGSIALIDFDDGEKVHNSQGLLELAASPPGTAAVTPVATVQPGTTLSDQFSALPVGLRIGIVVAALFLAYFVAMIIKSFNAAI